MCIRDRDKGALLKKGLEDMAAKYPTVVKEVRGVGMMLDVEFYSDEIGYEFSKEMYNHKAVSYTHLHLRHLRLGTGDHVPGLGWPDPCPAGRHH